MTAVESAILHILGTRHRMRGLDIVKADGGEYLARSSVYVLLARLQNRELVDSAYVGPESEGPRPREYWITETGKRAKVVEEVAAGPVVRAARHPGRRGGVSDAERRRAAFMPTTPPEVKRRLAKALEYGGEEAAEIVL